MEFAVDVTPRAEADIEQAYDYIREASPAAARRWVVGLRQHIRSLGLMPARCALAPEADELRAELRQLLVGRCSGIYRVIFCIQERDGVVQVLAVRHGSRDRLRAEDLEE